MFYKFVDGKARDTGTHTRREISEKQKFGNELHRPITEKIRDAKYAHLIIITFVALVLRTCS